MSENIENKDNSEKNEKNSIKKNSVIREIMEWIIVVEVAVILAVVINLFFIVNAVIPTASMEPTIMTHSRIFGNRLAYLNSSPERGDIVIFKFPDNEKELFIKRVIGLPGDTVEMRDGLIYINGSDTALDEPYVKERPYGDYGPVTVPEGAYFMMGDNRNNSADSRYWNQPFVYEDKILGQAAIEYYPKIKKIE